MTMTVHPIRAVVLTTASAGAAWGLADLGASQAALPATVESVITAAVVLGGAAASLAVALLTIAALAEALLGWRPRAASALPAPLRRFLTGTVAAAVIVGAALPAAADEVYPGWAPTEPVASANPTPGPASPSPSPSDVVVVGEAASAPVSAPAASAAAQPRSEAPPVREAPPTERPPSDSVPRIPSPSSATSHVVERGDSLWRIAQRLLGPEASDADIARAWPLIYQANRATIGDDPGLILPGQELTIPRAVAA